MNEYPEENSGILSDESAAQFQIDSAFGEEESIVKEEVTIAGEIPSETPEFPDPDIDESGFVVEDNEVALEVPEKVYPPISPFNPTRLDIPHISPRGITKSTKKDSKKVAKAKKKMAKLNNKKIRHHKTKKEKKFRWDSTLS